jgi:hypothetical protein
VTAQHADGAPIYREDSMSWLLQTSALGRRAVTAALPGCRPGLTPAPRSFFREASRAGVLAGVGFGRTGQAVRAAW